MPVERMLLIITEWFIDALYCIKTTRIRSGVQVQTTQGGTGYDLKAMRKTNALVPCTNMAERSLSRSSLALFLIWDERKSNKVVEEVQI